MKSCYAPFVVCTISLIVYLGRGDFLLSDALDFDVKSTATLLYKKINAALLVPMLRWTNKGSKTSAL